MRFNAGMRTRRVFAGVCGVALAALLSFPGIAFADTAAEVQAEADAALASLNAMQEKLNQASHDYETAMYERDEAQAKADEAQVRIDETNAKIDKLQERLGSRANSMYRNGSASFLDLILGSATFEEFSNNLSFLNIMNQNDADLVQESKDLRAVVEAEKAEYDAQKKAAEEAAAEAERVKKEAEETVATMQATYDSLSAEAAELLAAEQAAQAAAAAAAQEAAEQAAATNTPVTNNNAGNTGTVWNPSTSQNTNTTPYAGSGIVDRAQYYVGNAQYVWGACSPGAFDCSGFVSYCVSGSYTRLGTTYTFMGWPQVSDPQPGDICVNAGHCGIYVGGGQMIHAASPGQGVVYGPVQGGMIYVRP